MPGLVLEGGTFRSIYTAGALDCLLEYNIIFPYGIGVSAGISNGVSYFSRQHGRNMEILRQFRNDPRYISKSNFIRHRSPYGIDFVFDTIPNELIPFDFEAFSSHAGSVLAGVTNVVTGEAEYIDCRDGDTRFTLLRASCAIPGVFPAIKYNDNVYYDGGIADPITIKKSIADGQLKNLIILTQPKGYRKRASKTNDFAAWLLQSKYPALSRLIRTRHNYYNDTLEYCELLEQKEDAVLLRPEFELNSMEKDIDQLERNYEHGYESCRKQLDRIRALFG